MVDVFAESGSSVDIQTAVDAVGAEGGNVYVPAGNFTFNIDFSRIRMNNQWAGVQVPGGVNIKGAGNDQTILNCPLSGWRYDLKQSQSMFILDGRNNKPIDLSGIRLQGSVNTAVGADDDRMLNGVVAYGVRDFRVHHNTFIDFCNYAVGTSNNYAGNAEGNCGVIDHNIIDNPYKDTFYQLTGNFAFWAYGVIAGGSVQWRTLNQVMGQYGRDITFIEDNSFRRCRHAIAEVGGGDGGWYVARHNTFTEQIISFYGSYMDVHGGGRGAEIYNNVVTDSPTDERSVGNQPQYFGLYMGTAVNPRGGSMLVFDNTFNLPERAVLLSNDQSENELWSIDGVWIWNNIYNNVPYPLAVTPNAYPIVENSEYFLHAPTQAELGFAYTPYPYPHPLVLDTQGVMAVNSTIPNAKFTLLKVS